MMKAFWRIILHLFSIVTVGMGFKEFAEKLCERNSCKLALATVPPLISTRLGSFIMKRSVLETRNFSIFSNQKKSPLPSAFVKALESN